jgi:putative hydrolases of HD superfamily
MTTHRDVSFLFELGTLRHVQRTWTQFGGLDLANVSEHSFRVAWISLVIALDERADVGRCLQLALLHDVPESRTGDVNYVQRMYTVRSEARALADALDETSVKSHLMELWEEWEQRKTIEARIVADADNLDCDFELREQKDRGSLLPGKLAPTRTAVRELLQTESARRIFDDVAISDPHDWHLYGRNRLTCGDWAAGPRECIEEK